MPQMKSTRVYRGGETAPSLTFETNTCSASIDQKEECLEIRFKMASKGGGTTCVLLEIGKGDFQTILEEIVNKLPSSVGTLADGAAVANKKNLELLRNALQVRDDERARAKKSWRVLNPSRSL